MFVEAWETSDSLQRCEATLVAHLEPLSHLFLLLLLLLSKNSARKSEISSGKASMQRHNSPLYCASGKPALCYHRASV
jgi:short-subunit dehydrogenase involved in D-alanine esterification of teichoic acids